MSLFFRKSGIVSICSLSVFPNFVHFLWYLVLLPLAICEIQISVKEGALLAITWIAGQGFWLKNGYDLEFKRVDSFNDLLFSSVIFVLVNSFIISIFVSRRHLLPENIRNKKLE